MNDPERDGSMAEIKEKIEIERIIFDSSGYGGFTKELTLYV